MRQVFAICLAVLAILATGAQAGSMPCGPRSAVLGMLAEAAQTRRATGQAGQAMMETFANPDTGAWTITISLPDGRMCLLANGQGYTARDEPFPASGRAI